ncbi:MAG: MBL fold metallo-hydrolase [Acidobacteriota bacterium]
MQPYSICSVARRVTVFLAFVCLATVAVAQPDFDSATVTSAEVAPGIYMLTGVGGNLGLSVGDDGAFLVDDQYAPMTDKILAAIAELTDQPVRFVVNTHWHGDHSGGNENFGGAGALIVAHDKVRERMSTEQVMELFGRTVPPSPAAALPVITYDDAVTFHVNGQTLHAFHVPPAHTDGDSIVHFREANVVHMGDLFFNGMFPFVDTGSGGSVLGLIDAIETVLSMVDDDTQIIPGHGPLASKSDLAGYHAMLLQVRAAVEPLVRAGKSRDEVVAAAPLDPLDAEWGRGFMKRDVFTGIVYDSLSSSM